MAGQHHLHDVSASRWVLPSSGTSSLHRPPSCSHRTHPVSSVIKSATKGGNSQQGGLEKKCTFFFLLRQGLTHFVALAGWNSLCRADWPWTQRFPCLLSATTPYNNVCLIYPGIVGSGVEVKSHMTTLPLHSWSFIWRHLHHCKWEERSERWHFYTSTPNHTYQHTPSCCWLDSRKRLQKVYFLFPLETNPDYDWWWLWWLKENTGLSLPVMFEHGPFSTMLSDSCLVWRNDCFHEGPLLVLQNLPLAGFFFSQIYS